MQNEHWDWLTERAPGYTISGLLTVSRKKIVFFFHVINPLLAKLVWSSWLDVGLVLFFPCLYTWTSSKKLGQYPTILTSCLVNNP